MLPKEPIETIWQYIVTATDAREQSCLEIPERGAYY